MHCMHRLQYSSQEDTNKDEKKKEKRDGTAMTQIHLAKYSIETNYKQLFLSEHFLYDQSTFY